MGMRLMHGRTRERSSHDARTFSLWSICRTVSPSVDVQLGGGLPGPPPYIELGPPVDACAIPQRLLSPSFVVAVSAPEKR